MTNNTYWTDDAVHMWLSIIHQTRGTFLLAPFVIKHLVACEYIRQARGKWHLTDEGAAELIRLTLVLPPRNLQPA